MGGGGRGGWGGGGGGVGGWMIGEEREGEGVTLFSWLYKYFTYLPFVRFEHSVCRGAPMT